MEAGEAFQSDPVRILRAIYFMAKFNHHKLVQSGQQFEFKLANETEIALRRYSYLLNVHNQVTSQLHPNSNALSELTTDVATSLPFSMLSPDRLRHEIEKLFFTGFGQDSYHLWYDRYKFIYFMFLSHCLVVIMESFSMFFQWWHSRRNMRKCFIRCY
jgi:tRNA nucleotidyltransferase/poly(A) polymerase